MGFVIPPYNIDPRVYDKIMSDLAGIMKDKFPAEKQRELTYRPLRPEEINAALTTATRIYNSVIGAAFTRILGAAADASVKTGSVYVFFGWIVIDDPTGVNPLGINGVVQLIVEGAIRAEMALEIINQQPGKCMVTLDQEVVLVENTTFTIQAKGLAGGVGIIFPLAFRIGPKSQLDIG